MCDERVDALGENLAVIMDEHGCTLSVVYMGDGKVILNERNLIGHGNSFSCSVNALVDALAKACDRETLLKALASTGIAASFVSDEGGTIVRLSE
jgi:hypothetical protein